MLAHSLSLVTGAFTFFPLALQEHVSVLFFPFYAALALAETFRLF